MTVWVFRVALGIAAGSIPVLQAMIILKLVTWSPWTVIWVASGVGIVTFFDNLRVVLGKFRAHERAASRSRMYEPLVGALDQVRNATGVELSSLGISVFVLRPGSWWPWRRLKRVLRFRLGNHPPPSDIHWTKGKGVIGECWRTGIPVLLDRRAVIARYGRNHYPTEVLYESLPEQVKSGFKLEEFIQTINKYGEILAVPIRHRHSGALLGVLSIDCVADAYTSAEHVILAGNERIAADAAYTVSEEVPKF